MNIDFSEKLRDVEGNVLVEGGRDVELWRVCQNVLLAFDPQAKTTGEEKAKRYGLAVELVDGGAHDLAVEDVALIKKLVGDLMAPLVVGQVWRMLEKSDRVAEA